MMRKGAVVGFHYALDTWVWEMGAILLCELHEPVTMGCVSVFKRIA